jgi:hypothetical protein
MRSGHSIRRFSGSRFAPIIGAGALLLSTLHALPAAAEGDAD